MSKIEAASICLLLSLLLPSLQGLPRCPQSLNGEEWKNSTCQCFRFDQVPEKRINLEKLTVGDSQNRLSVDDFGEICITGDVKLPEGFMTPNDTLELEMKILYNIFGPTNILPCSVMYTEIENMLLMLTKANEASAEEGKSEENTDYSWVRHILDNFDSKTCILSDICGLLKNKDIQTLLKSLMDENPLNMNISSSDFATVSQVCSSEFLSQQIYSLDACLPINLGDSSEIERYKPFVAGLTGVMDGIMIGVDLEVRKVAKDGSGPQEPILCIVLPLTVRL